jgi:hypothetical protein
MTCARSVHSSPLDVLLGDAGQAIELAEQIDPASLSAERHAGICLTSPQAHTIWRQIGGALHAIQEAERIAPEETRVHYIGRAVAGDLLQLSGLRPRPELRDHAGRVSCRSSKPPARARVATAINCSVVTLVTGCARYPGQACGDALSCSLWLRPTGGHVKLNPAKMYRLSPPLYCA